MDIYQILKEEILNGTIPLGERLIEKDLAEKYSVSRTRIRDAIRKVDADGLIISLPNKGASVRSYTLENVKDSFNIRAQIEGYACSLAAQNKTDKGIYTLLQSIEISERAVTLYKENKIDDSVNELAQANLLFHETITKLSGNVEIPKVLKPLITLPMLVRGFYWYDYEGIINSIQQHKSILTAIENGDTLAAKSIMEAHIYTGRDNILRNIKTVNLTKDL